MRSSLNTGTCLALWCLCIVIFAFYAQIYEVSASSTVDIFAYVQGCNNGQIDVGEQCDGSNLGGATCATIGFTEGTLSCSSVCTHVTDQCTLQSKGGSAARPRYDNDEWVSPARTNIIVSGATVPLSRILLFQNGVVVTTSFANPEGLFQVTVSNVPEGKSTVFILVFHPNQTMSYSQTYVVDSKKGLSVKISDIPLILREFQDATTPRTQNEERNCALPVYAGNDCRINSIDFIMMRQRYLQSLPSEQYDLNGDGTLDLTDFSILAYHWTG